MQDIKNDLLKRREIKFIVESQANPGFTNSLKLVCDNFNAKEENVAIKAVKSKFGRNTFLIDAFIYDSAKDKEFLEPRPKAKKKAEGAN